MTRLSLVRAAGLVVAAACVLGGAPPASGSSDSSLSVGFDKGRVDLVVGDKFTLTSTITNDGAAPSPPVVAHLNVASLTSDVYVDPEDWSSSRSKYLPVLAPGETVDVTWSLQAVNSGWFDVYAVLLPRGASSLGADPLVVSHAVLARVGGKQTANPGGALPAVLGVPVLIGVAALWSRRRRRRPL